MTKRDQNLVSKKALPGCLLSLTDTCMKRQNDEQSFDQTYCVGKGSEKLYIHTCKLVKEKMKGHVVMLKLKKHRNMIGILPYHLTPST